MRAGFGRHRGQAQVRALYGRPGKTELGLRFAIDDTPNWRGEKSCSSASGTGSQFRVGIPALPRVRNWNKRIANNESASTARLLLAFSVLSLMVIRLLAQTDPQPNPEAMNRYWQLLVPSLPSVLKQSFQDCCAEPHIHLHGMGIIQFALLKPPTLRAIVFPRPLYIWATAGLIRTISH